jgi:hypothetical protein
MKGCISRVELKPHVVNPLTVAGNKTKLRLVQYLIISLRTFEKIKPAVAKPKHKTLNT